jgi:hypothetical protein
MLRNNTRMIFTIQRSLNPMMTMASRRMPMSQVVPHRIFSTHEKFMKMDNHGEMQQALMDRQRKFDSSPTNLEIASKYFRELNRH